jgi:tetratricopeptide (TPR) repeat protein
MIAQGVRKLTIAVLVGILVACLLTPFGQAASKKDPPVPVKVVGEPALDPRAVEGFMNGLVLRGIGDYPGAIANFREALNYFPESDVIKQTLAELYFSLRGPKEALDLLSKVAVRDADFYRLQGACCQALSDDLGARTAFLQLVKFEPDNQLALSYILDSYQKAHDTSSSIWALEQLTQAKPDEAGTWNDLGRLYASKGMTDKTKSAFRTSLSIDSSGKNLIAYSFLADVYTFDKKYDSALVLLKQALQLDKDNLFLNNQMVALWLGLDSAAAALPYARRSAELRPTDGRMQRRLGVIYLRLDSLKTADSIFTEIVKAGEGIPADYYFLAQIAAEQKRYDVAKAQFEILVQREDTVEQNWQGLALSYAHLGDTAQAKQTYRRGLQHVVDDSSRVKLTYSLAAMMERSGEFDSAAVTFRELLKKWPGFNPALNYLGYMYADKGINLQEAKSLIEAAVKAEPQNAAYLDSYGWVFYRLDKFDKALNQLKKAAALTKDVTVFDHLADTYNAMGKTDEARQWWQKALELDPGNSAIKGKLGQ